MAVSANRLELLQIADAVAREKSIDRGIVIAAMEDAIQRAAKSRYGAENEIRAEIDAKSGEMRLNRLLLVVEKVENDATEIGAVYASLFRLRNTYGTTFLLVHHKKKEMGYRVEAPELVRRFPGLTPEVPRAFEWLVNGRQPLLRIGWAIVRPKGQ